MGEKKPEKNMAKFQGSHHEEKSGQGATDPTPKRILVAEITAYKFPRN